MANSAVENIESAIGRLTSTELQELYEWLDAHHPQAIDKRLAVDLDGGRLDGAIFRALDDEARGRTQPL
jgi:hypothetical protein